MTQLPPDASTQVSFVLSNGLNLNPLPHSHFLGVFVSSRVVAMISLNEDEFRIMFDAYRPTPSFKKSDPGVPDFSFCVCKYAHRAFCPDIAALRDTCLTSPRSL